MTDQTNNQAGAGDANDVSAAKATSNARTAKATEVRTVGKQKFTEKELKRLGLDPACYGYVKK